MKTIQAKTLLAHVQQPDLWFGLKYNMNLYRGCQHRCIYCDSRSACYQIDNFDHEVLVKENAIDLLQHELARKRVKGIIGTGSMNDPYMPLERQVNLTGRALQVIARFGFGVHILTKSDLVLRDLDALAEINRIFAAVSFTITTADDALGKQVEPGAPPVSARLAAMEALATLGIHTGVTLMPVLPFLEDNEENISAIVTRAWQSGASYVIPALGVTLRDRQRDYYYAQLDQLFPGLSQKYRARFGEQYHCPARDAERLTQRVFALCAQLGMATNFLRVAPPSPSQLRLF